MEGNRKKFILGILVLMTVVIFGIVGYYIYENTYYVGTEDAKITGDFVKVAPESTGKVIELFMEEGQMVQENQILGRIDSANSTDAAIEQSLIRAPISGIVVKKQGNAGEILSTAQVVGYLVDPNKLYITANIEETKLSNVKLGQAVNISVDQFKGVNFKGNVISIGHASAAAFSLLPSSTGSFTKTVQKIPVKIGIEKSNKSLLPGTNAVIKIHIK